MLKGVVYQITDSSGHKLFGIIITAFEFDDKGFEVVKSNVIFRAFEVGDILACSFVELATILSSELALRLFTLFLSVLCRPATFLLTDKATFRLRAALGEA
jgi:hypothetical protein